MSTSSLSKIWLKVEGPIVKEHKIEAASYGAFLISIQRVVNTIRSCSYEDKSKDSFRLFISETKKGSHISALQPIYSDVDLFSEKPVFDSLSNLFSSFIDSLLNDEERFIQLLETELTEPTIILKYLKNLKDLLSKVGKYQISIAFGPTFPQNFILLPSEKEKFLIDLIEVYREQASSQIIGIITRLKGDEPREFAIADEKGELVICDYPDEFDKEIRSNYLKQPIKVSGFISHGIRNRTLTEIHSIIPFTQERLFTIGLYTLTKPLTIEIEYNEKEKTWHIFNEDISIEGYGNSYSEALEDLDISLESFLVGILSFTDSELSEKSKNLKFNFNRFFNLEEVSKTYFSRDSN